ncbi:MAG TPA: IclR family transcriptional regulator C-terminal domain-containing protein [Steroidobacteraceae bacterium]|nr:IclR family transcriptional regulator C-terminal domain-containing protein [Steroidobacteraceae bacterium]
MAPPGKSGTPTGFEHSRDYVQSLARGLAVLTAFDAEHPSLGLAAIAARTGLSRAAARRLVLTLEHLGYVRAVGREYTLSPRVLELGFQCLSSLKLTDLAQPAIERLAQRLNHSCSMAVLDGQSIVYVLRVPVRRVMTVALGVGARLPAYAASMGRVLLAGLPAGSLDTWLSDCRPVQHTPHTVTDRQRLRRIVAEVRTQGYAYVEQELELGLCSIAVPIHDREGRVVAALNASMPYHTDAARHALQEVLPGLRATAKEVEGCLPANSLSPVSL